MKNIANRLVTVALLATAVSVLALISTVELSRKVAAKSVAPPAQSNVTIFATGLNNPRGLKFGPDGNLYVAEGGVGGTNSTVGTCDQVPFPIGPYTGSTTGARISKIDQNGNRTTFVDNLPSSQTSADSGSLVSGVGDVEFIGDTLYAVLAGAGCSHGVPTIPNGIIRVNANGTWTTIADLGAFQISHPIAHPDLGDFEPEGTWYSLIAVRGDLYAVEPNHSEIDRISPDTGAISRVVDMSSDPWWGPTAIAYKGNFFISNLGPFPIAPGTEQIRKLTPSGEFKTWATGLTTVVGLAFDERDRLYALESMTEPGFPGPSEFGAGKVVRIETDGTQTVVASGLSFPSAMTFGPDGALYVSNIGFGAPPIGLGQILRIEVSE